MDAPIVGAYFVAEAVRSDGGWSVLVNEYFGQDREPFETVVPTFVTPVASELSDLVATAFAPLIAGGWRLVSAARFEPFKTLVDIEPPDDNPPVAPMAGDELTFVRRCRGRGMSSMAAMRAYRSGERSPTEAAGQWKHHRSLTSVMAPV